MFEILRHALRKYLLADQILRRSIKSFVKRFTEIKNHNDFYNLKNSFFNFKAFPIFSVCMKSHVWSKPKPSSAHFIFILATGSECNQWYPLHHCLMSIFSSHQPFVFSYTDSKWNIKQTLINASSLPYMIHNHLEKSKLKFLDRFTFSQQRIYKR